MKIKKAINLNTIIYILLVLMLVYVSTKFNVTPKDNMDFVRHSYRIDALRRTNMSFMDFVFGNRYTFTYNSSMKYCYGFSIAQYITAKFFKNDYVLVWTFILIDYSIISYIGIDWWKNTRHKNVIMVVYEMLICYSMLPFIHAVSGLRTGIASCFCALGIYNFLFKNKSLANFIFCFLISVSFHSLIIIALPFILIAKYIKTREGLIMVLAISLGTSLFVNVLSRTSLGFFSMLARKYLEYTAEDGYRGTRFCYYGVIVISFLVFLQYINVIFLDSSRGKNSINEKDTSKIYNFIVYYMIFVLSNIGNYEMVMRPGYLLGALAPITTGMIFTRNHSKKYSYVISIPINCALLAIIIYVSYMYFTYYSIWFMQRV